MHNASFARRREILDQPRQNAFVKASAHRALKIAKYFYRQGSVWVANDGSAFYLRANGRQLQR
jgi:hypothetical protein